MTERYTPEQLYEMAAEYAHNSELASMLRQVASDAARIAELEAFIAGVGNDLLQRRVADWYPEGAHNAASAMSEDMRLIGNACIDIDAARSRT